MASEEENVCNTRQSIMHYTHEMPGRISPESLEVCENMTFERWSGNMLVILGGNSGSRDRVA